MTTIESSCNAPFEVTMRFTLSNGLYGKRSPLTIDCYQPMPGWLIVAIGSYTLEVCWASQAGRARIRQRA